MSIKHKLVSKVATLEGSRTIFFIVAGLAIKESLALFSIERPALGNSSKRLFIGMGFLILAIKASHKTAMIYAHEKERIENTNCNAPR